MAKISSGHRKMQAVRKQRSRQTDKFVKSTGKLLKKIAKSFK